MRPRREAGDPKRGRNRWRRSCRRLEGSTRGTAVPSRPRAAASSITRSVAPRPADFSVGTFAGCATGGPPWRVAPASPAQMIGAIDASVESIVATDTAASWEAGSSGTGPPSLPAATVIGMPWSLSAWSPRRASPRAERSPDVLGVAERSDRATISGRCRRRDQAGERLRHATAVVVCRREMIARGKPIS